MQGIRPQNLTDRELLNYAHLTGYDKLPVEWVTALATRLEAWVSGDEKSIEKSMDARYDEGYEAGHAAGYETGYAQGADDAEDDGK
jgi:hypothetical protein